MNDENKKCDILRLTQYMTPLGTSFGNILFPRICSHKTFPIGESCEEGGIGF